ncbi:MAG: DeoR/GlpR transcriptional regulator [Ruminococcaceae bacterium]|nr:DeoR/GlpR transcriptional regulator [Oscillospiraceae bacterium]
MSKRGDEMGISQRQNQILELLQIHGFLTVNRLSELTFTSPSSIRRDLSQLQNLCLVKRTHGGVTVLTENNQAIPLNNRMTQNVKGKRIIAQKAAVLLRDGQSIMLDGSTTASFLIPYIAGKKDIRLFTNNMMTAINAINHGICTHCIGGDSVNNSAVLSGEAAYEAARGICPDILFFSSRSIDRNGRISDPTKEENYLRSIMLHNARKRVFLCDSEKFNRQSLYELTCLNHVDIAVFDVPYPELKVNCEIL